MARKLTFSRELNTTDLIKSLIAIMGAVFAFCFVTSVQLENSRAKIENDSLKLKLELTKVLPTLQPHVQSNMTNRINPYNPRVVDIKLYLKILSGHSVYFFPPKIKLIRIGTENEEYAGKIEPSGIYAYKGLFSPGTDYNINYSVKVQDEAVFNDYEIVLEFDIETDEKIQNAYAKVLDVLGDTALDEIDKISYKTHKFRDVIYFENLKFEVFPKNN